MPDDPRDQLPPSDEELQDNIAKESFEDLFVSLTTDYERMRSPRHSWEVRWMSQQNFNRAALQALRESDESEVSKETIKELAEQIEVTAIPAIHMTSQLYNDRWVVELASPGTGADNPPEESWKEAMRFRSEQAYRTSYLASLTLTHELVAALKKVGILPWKADDVGGV